MDLVAERGVLLEQEDWRLRELEARDNERVCQIFRDIHLPAALSIAQEREPDFQALLRMHGGAHHTFVLETLPNRVIEGCASAVVRDGYVNGAIHKVGYLCDLRATPNLRGRRVLPKTYAAAMDYLRTTHGAEVFYTVVFDSNARARSAIVERKEHRKDQPAYHVVTPFNMTSVQFTTPKPKPERSVVRARDSDLEQLVEFLAARHRRKLFGEVMTEARLRERFTTWPEFSLASFLLAKDAAGRIVGCVAPWNTRSFKRTRVLGYHGAMRASRWAFNLAACVRGFPALPRVGDLFDFAFLTHLEADDAGVMCDLVRAAYAELLPERLHFMSAMVPRGSPFEAVFKELFVTRSPMTLYAVCAADGPWASYDFSQPNSGFEMALS